MPPQKSEVWKHFTKLNERDVRCNICFKVLKHSGNTSNMKKHILNHPTANLSSSQRSDPDTIHHTESAASTSSTSAQSPITKKRQLSIGETIYKRQSYAEGGSEYSVLLKCLLYFICVDKRPFDVVKGRGFRRLMRQACPSFKLPSVDTLKTHLDTLYNTMYNRTKDIMFNTNHIALTCDIWSEMMTTTSYIGVTAHYIQNCNLISRCIATLPLKERHTGDHIAEKLKEIAQGIGVTDPQKISAIVTDNGPNIVSAVNKYLEKNKHLPCFAHSLNLVIEAILSNSEFSSICSKVREVVKFFKSSVVQSDLLRSKQSGNPLKLKLDVKTRWNSTFYMLERYHKLAPVVHQILMLNTSAPPTPTAIEIESIEMLLKVLKPVEHVTKELSGEQYITISKIIPIVNCLKQQINNLNLSCNIAAAVKDDLLKQIDKRFGHVEANHLASISCLLDPRFKNIHFQDAVSCSKAITYLKREVANPNTSPQSDDTFGNDDSETVPVEETDVFDFWSHHKTLAYTNKATKTSTGSIDEVKMYLDMPVIPLKSNPLEQWEDMKTMFPNLYKIAAAYLIIPATSVPSERLFSKAGATVSKVRNRLSPKRLNKLMFLADCTEQEWQL